jgi:hypothetical protein
MTSMRVKVLAFVLLAMCAAQEAAAQAQYMR